MTILANEHKAINLAQGFPEFAPPEKLTQTLEKISTEKVHQYAPNWGISEQSCSIFS